MTILIERVEQLNVNSQYSDRGGFNRMCQKYKLFKQQISWIVTGLIKRIQKAVSFIAPQH